MARTIDPLPVAAGEVGDDPPGTCGAPATRALPHFEERASLLTWVFRIAHNVAASHVAKSRRDRGRTMAPLSALEEIPVHSEPEAAIDRAALVDRVATFVRNLRPIDRQVMVLYLEGLDQREIAEVTGLSATHVSTKVHRIRATLTRRFAAAAKTGGA